MVEKTPTRPAGIGAFIGRMIPFGTDPRSIKADRNILASLIFKGLNVVAVLLVIRLTLEYLTAVTFGIWITIFSILEWATFLNLGLGPGLRTRFSEALAAGQTNLSKIFISTAYGASLIISGSVLGIFLIFNRWIDWGRILNTDVVPVSELRSLAVVILLFFMLRMVFGLIGSVLAGDQRPAFNDFFEWLGNLALVIGLIVLIRTSDNSLILLGWVRGFIPVAILFLATLWLFSRRYKSVKPSIRWIRLKAVKSLTGLGIKYFIIHVCTLIIFTTDNLIITQIFGPSEVTPYGIARKYFYFVIVLFTTFCNPYWSAFTEAHAKGDRIWIRNGIRRLGRFWILTAALTVAMLALSRSVYRIWIGGSVQIPIALSVMMALFVSITSWGHIFGTFLSGTGQVKLQTLVFVIMAIVNIPLSIVLAKTMNMGPVGVIAASCICVLIISGTLFLQYTRIITGRASGLWIK